MTGPGVPAEPPQDVRLAHPDGTTVPVEVVYDRLDAAGIHRWVAVVPSYLVHPGSTLEIGRLPAKTSVGVVVTTEEETAP